ncbi:hypothetical protein DPMN_078302 [Dreissena polymorpha]|uniref:Uncharacterized protein n=1 Tax=Dreissena polymorpha TaxID=45954 RepID=A0A9D3YQA7_DREPO|nr:hypothetical protein DPMN_078302 [Dreissena polymorpha]
MLIFSGHNSYHDPIISHNLDDDDDDDDDGDDVDDDDDDDDNDDYYYDCDEYSTLHTRTNTVKTRRIHRYVILELKISRAMADRKDAYKDSHSVNTLKIRMTDGHI